MDRFLKSTAAELRVTFYGAAGVPVDATGTPTVTITGADAGTIVTAAATTKVAATTGIYAYTLTPAQTADLDLLAAAWTGVIEGTSQTFYTEGEIVGGFVCSIEQINDQLDRGGTASSYDLDLKLAARNYATEAFESVAGVVFSPRYATRVFDGPWNRTDLLLPTPRVTAIRSVAVDGVALTGTDLTDLGLTVEGAIYRSTGWPTGRLSIDVGWEHGFASTPADVARAIAIVAAHVIKDGPFDDRGYAVTEDGGAVRLLTAGVAGASFSIPDVEAALQRHTEPTVA